MLSNLYSEMGSLLLEIAQRPMSIETIKAGLKYSETLLSGFKKTPDIVVAQPLLYKANLSYIENLCFNSCTYLLLLCNANKINDVCSQQLICGVLTLYAKQKHKITTQFGEGLKQYTTEKFVTHCERKLLTSYHQYIWLDTCSVCDQLFQRPINIKVWPEGLSRLQRLVYLAHVLSVLITQRQNQKPRNFAQVLKQLCVHCPDSWANDLEVLLGYPGTIPPGTVIKQKSATTALVLSVSKDKLLVTELSPAPQAKKAIFSLYKQNINGVSGVQKVSSLMQVESWWGLDWLDKYTVHNQYCSPNTALFRLNKPPAVLLEVQKHLNSDEIDIDKLALQISQEPYFADYIKQTATISNRNKLPVQRVKHGLMMHGYERTNSMLIEHLLLSRLNQNYFPLQQDFIQFTRLRAQIAATLAEAIDGLAGENASVLACFSSAGLFTQPSLKSRTIWRRDNQRQYDIQALFVVSSAANLHDHGVKLAQAWQQPTLFISCLNQQRLMPEKFTSDSKEARKLTVILGLSLIGAIQVFFDDEHVDDATLDYIKQALTLLKLEEAIFAGIRKQALSICHTYRSI